MIHIYCNENYIFTNRFDGLDQVVQNVYEIVYAHEEEMPDLSIEEMEKELEGYGYKFVYEENPEDIRDFDDDL